MEINSIFLKCIKYYYHFLLAKKWFLFVKLAVCYTHKAYMKKLLHYACTDGGHLLLHLAERAIRFTLSQLSSAAVFVSSVLLRSRPILYVV